MVCYGSKVLRRSRPKSSNLDTEMLEEDDNYSKKGRKDDVNKKSKKGNSNSGGGKAISGNGRNIKGLKMKNMHEKGNRRVDNEDVKKKNVTENLQNASEQKILLRKRVDPETAKYFDEIARLFESNEVDIEDRPGLCANAIEETHDKEVELATDGIISHTLQILLEGCELEQLCGFLQNCAGNFSVIAMDKFGSHVAETALKTLSMHLQNDASIRMVEDTLTIICQMVVLDTIKIMQCPYGSHVLRSLLCICKGISADSLKEFHATKSSVSLAERLNCPTAKPHDHTSENSQHGFPHLFDFVTKGLLQQSQADMAALRTNKYSSFVLQTLLKLLVGYDQELLDAILVIVGSKVNNMEEGKFIDVEMKSDIIALLEDTAFSHLFEVIIDVAPVTVYDVFLNEVFKGSMFKLSSLQCGNFVVQALVASAKTKDQVTLIWEELGTKLEELLANGKSGVVASIIATCQRLQINVQECCNSLAAAVSSGSDSVKYIVPHLLFLEDYFRQKSSWIWPVGGKMHTLGCLMLQIIFKCPKKYIEPYITSLSSMDAEHVFETANDAGGSRVFETFLCSEASAKQKIDIISKLQNHFGELAMHPSSSFTVEKCFTACNMPLKESIASELLAVQADLSKTKQGPYLSRKLDIEGLARRPEQWRRSQASKVNIYKEFHTAFGSDTQQEDESEPSQNATKKRKTENKETDNKFNQNISNSTCLDSQLPNQKPSVKKSRFLSDKNSEKSKELTKKQFLKNRAQKAKAPFLRNSGKRKSPGDELVDLASKKALSSGDMHKLFRSSTFDEIKQSGKVKKPFLKKQKM